MTATPAHSRRPWPARALRPLRRLGCRVRALAREARLHLRNRLGTGPAVHGEGAVVVSLTSHGARLKRCFLAVETLFDQREPPAAVRLNLAARELGEADLPASLQRLRRRGLHIAFVDPDYQPGNKLIPTLAESPDRILVTADDDRLYPRGWLAGLLAAHREHPGAIVCYRGLEVPVAADGTLLPPSEPIRKPAGEATVPGPSLMATGVSGVLYPPGALHPAVHDHAAMMSLCPTEDDVWFKVMSLFQGTHTRLVHPRTRSWLRVTASQRAPLFRRNVARHGASPKHTCLRRVLDAYGVTTLADATAHRGDPAPGTARPDERMAQG